MLAKNDRLAERILMQLFKFLHRIFYIIKHAHTIPI